ncbi:MAG: polyprenyl synthetase family protein [Tissierellia bacterium]|nr:polyprenyl synthetase family protein [Tissierellia bacterium]
MKKTYEALLRDMEALFAQALEGEVGAHLGLRQAMDYSFSSGGKRVRPLLLFASLKAYSQDLEEAIPFACALECIHTYSLIHDDLPAMDDDDFRRGQPSSHKKFGEAMAILAGDGLLNLSAQLVLKGIKDLSPDKRARGLEAASYLFFSSGIGGMVDGQAHDIAKEEEVPREFLYREKTGALLSAALAMGGILGGAQAEEVEKLKEMGYILGVGYQFQDDLFDLREDKRAPQEKAHFEALAGDYNRRAWELLESMEGDFQDLEDLFKRLLDRRR